METNHEDLWVANRLATIEPQWSPSLARGRELLNVRLEGQRSHSWTRRAACVAGAALCVAALAFPGTRAIAQEFWFRFVLNRVDVVRLDLSKLPLHMQVTTNGMEQRVQNVDDAERRAGFKPYLPSPGTLDAIPDITVTGSILVEQTIHVREIESALGKVGASDVHVPAEWEGVQLRSEIGPLVAENYADNIRILQARPGELSVPSGFDLERFAAVAFQSIGVSSWESHAMAQKFADHPSWLLDLPPYAEVNVREVALESGPALLIEDFDQKGGVKEATVIRSTSERMYSVSSRNQELSIRIANALP